MLSFRAYDPATIQAKSYSTACEQCYARKVKCELLPDEKHCKQCVDHGVDCVARTRKRKAQSIDEGQREHDNSVLSLPSPPASSSRQDASNASHSLSTVQNQQKRRASNLSRTPRPGKRSNSVMVPELFINREGRGYSPGSSEQIESPTQDRFRNASYISRSAILGKDFEDIDHAHTEREVDDSKVSSTELKILKMHGAFELPDLPLRQSLIEAYVERCFTYMPVVELETLSGASQTGECSLIVLQAVILVGSLMRPDVCGKAFCDRQYARVKALIQSGYERNPLNILAALCLIQWYTPTAPKDISTDVPRFWNTYGIGLAQQMGLHRAPIKQVPNPGLRRRIWWTMVARDNLTASAHGRPRQVQSEDCTVSNPSIHDFPVQQDVRAEIFTYYVAITRILGDLCQVITRNGEASPENKQNIAVRLQSYLERLPESLRLYSPSGLAQQYNLDLAQLHIPILIAITILFRPRTVFELTAANAASATAAFLSFRVFQAIQLREQTRYLSSAFAWHLLVTAIPLLSCTKVASLQVEADEALDSIENVLETLGRVRPAAANNIRNVRAIRKAMSSSSRDMGGNTPRPESHDTPTGGTLHIGRQLLQAYGDEAVIQYAQIVEVLHAHSNHQADRHAQAAAHTLSCLSGNSHPTGTINGRLTPEPSTYVPSINAQDDIAYAFTAVFEDDTLSTSWMMKDWMDELQL